MYYQRWHAHVPRIHDLEFKFRLSVKLTAGDCGWPCDAGDLRQCSRFASPGVFRKPSDSGRDVAELEPF